MWRRRPNVGHETVGLWTWEKLSPTSSSAGITTSGRADRGFGTGASAFSRGFGAGDTMAASFAQTAGLQEIWGSHIGDSFHPLKFSSTYEPSQKQLTTGVWIDNEACELAEASEVVKGGAWERPVQLYRCQCFLDVSKATQLFLGFGLNKFMAHNSTHNFFFEDCFFILSLFLKLRCLFFAAKPLSCANSMQVQLQVCAEKRYNALSVI